MAMLGANQLVQMRRQRERSLQDTCVITPSVRPGETATPMTVPCNVRNNPSAGSGSGGFSGRNAGGGNQIARRFERSVVLPYGTTAAVAATLYWVQGDETITIADVEEPGTFGMTVKVHGARTASS